MDKDVLQHCLATVSQGRSINSVASESGVARATLQRHVLASQAGQPMQPPGNLPYLPPILAAEIAVVAKTAARHGFGLSKKDLRVFVGDAVISRLEGNDDTGLYLRKHCHFQDQLPSHDWVEKYMKDNRLSLVKPSPLERCRFQSAADPFIIYEFFDLVKDEMTRLDLLDKPSHIFNLDETCFFLDPSRGKVVSATGGGRKTRVTSGPGRQSFSAMDCISAEGTAQPPLIISPGKTFL